MNPSTPQPQDDNVTATFEPIVFQPQIITPDHQPVPAPLPPSAPIVEQSEATSIVQADTSRSKYRKAMISGGVFFIGLPLLEILFALANGALDSEGGGWALVAAVMHLIVGILIIISIWLSYVFRKYLQRRAKAGANGDGTTSGAYDVRLMTNSGIVLSVITAVFYALIIHEVFFRKSSASGTPFFGIYTLIVGPVVSILGLIGATIASKKVQEVGYMRVGVIMLLFLSPYWMGLLCVGIINFFQYS